MSLGDFELTPAQVAHAKLAGIPADRPGLLGEYPRMLYRSGNGGDHNLLDTPLPIQGHKGVETVIVHDELEELEASEHGWTRTIDGKVIPADDKDALIAELQAQLLAQTTLNDAPRRGRPPKTPEDAAE